MANMDKVAAALLWFPGKPELSRFQGPTVGTKVKNSKRKILVLCLLDSEPANTT